jgi:prevent-host-death family protein
MKNEATSEVGVLEAKTQLSHLIERVEHGETIVITRHGQPVAKLVRFDGAVDVARIRDAVARLMHFGEAEGIRLPEGMTIHDLLREGRR